MPELPEVETTRRGIEPYIKGAMVTDVIVRQRQLRYPVPPVLLTDLPGQCIKAVERRGKYLLIGTDAGTVIIHLGMSGNLRLLELTAPVEKHDHLDIVIENEFCLRFHDPRRFGAVLWTCDDPAEHKLLASLGPEPLGKSFSGEYLYERSRKRRQSIKQFIMDSHIVVGVGNIYASEALFLAGIRPRLAAGKISRQRCDELVKAIKKILRAAIKQGGTTLRDFVGGTGKPGYFKQRLNVYGRAGEPCSRCETPIKQLRLGQRASYYCPHCQR